MIEPKPDSLGHFSCTFCGKHQREVRKLVRGFHGVICNECVALCKAILREGGPSYAASATPYTSNPSATAACAFCAKPVDKVPKLIAGPPGQYICEECVGSCNEIIAEEAGHAP